jgi:hypothetical protein
VALIIEKLTAARNNIQLFLPHKITNQRNIAKGTRAYTDSSFINAKMSSKLALALLNLLVLLDHKQIPHKNLNYLDFHCLYVKLMESLFTIYL